MNNKKRLKQHKFIIYQYICSILKDQISETDEVLDKQSRCVVIKVGVCKNKCFYSHLLSHSFLGISRGDRDAV